MKDSLCWYRFQLRDGKLVTIEAPYRVDAKIAFSTAYPDESDRIVDEGRVNSSTEEKVAKS